MADLQTVLGALLATGFAGRSLRGPAFAETAPAATPTLAPLASLARRARHDRQRRTAAPPRRRWLGLLQAPAPAPSDAAPPVALDLIDEARALLLIRAMIAAAHADVRIGPEERGHVLAQLREAGAGPDEAQLLETELQAPCAVEEIARQVNDLEMAEQVFLASELALPPDGAGELTYLRHLGDRLNLPPDRIAALRRIP